ncbi:hypothetical protein LPB137_10205 [Poseidonibacter parvus]|uniref:Uncharacterized protein n=1 Tax=Poseidonibacter parvus TaxID=1850254 RepID=A0A1P8KNV7_9BACT|nr:hypothetical protein [Poseidonibacter parvus]APW66193.1 hypothetical protein LPB137_10205 [Poseidonibacter parvus]
MASRCEDEFNPWPSFVDIFSSVILVLLLFLLVVLVNLGYYAQFKYKVSYTGSISNDDIILNNNRSSEENELNTKKVTDPSAGSNSNSDINIKIINEQKQRILTLQNQIEVNENQNSAEKSNKIESAGIDIADKNETNDENQKIIENKDYLIVTYKSNEIFVDDGITRKIKQFLSSAKERSGKHEIHIYTKDMKKQLSATISKQISLARTISTRNLIRKFGYEKKDVKIDLTKEPNIKEKIDDTNGYLVITIKK